jgi:integrase
MSCYSTPDNAESPSRFSMGAGTKNVAKLVDNPRFSKREMSIWEEEHIIKFIQVAQEDHLFLAFFLQLGCEEAKFLIYVGKTLI